jgi:hypothetical protein
LPSRASFLSISISDRQSQIRTRRFSNSHIYRRSLTHLAQRFSTHAYHFYISPSSVLHPQIIASTRCCRALAIFFSETDIYQRTTIDVPVRVLLLYFHLSTGISNRWSNILRDFKPRVFGQLLSNYTATTRCPKEPASPKNS